MTHTLTIQTRRPRMTSNDQRKWHWSRVRREKAAMQVEVWAAAKNAKIPPATGPVTVSVVWHPPTRTHRDSDSLGPFVKAALDALVNAGIFPDDNSKYVRSVTSSIGDYAPTNPRIEIHIHPVTP